MTSRKGPPVPEGPPAPPGSFYAYRIEHAVQAADLLGAFRAWSDSRIAWRQRWGRLPDDQKPETA